MLFYHYHHYFQYFHLVRYVLVEPAVQEGVDTGGAHGGEVDAEEGEEVKPESVDVSEEIQPEDGKCRRKNFKFRTR